MVRLFITTLISVLTLSGSAQNKPGGNPSETAPPQLGVAATYAPGLLQGQDEVNFYLHLHGFVFLEPQLSLRGDVFSWRSSTAERPVFKQYNSLHAGLSYHFRKYKSFDPYAGATLGVGYTQRGEVLSVGFSEKAINPLVMPHLGFRLFAPKFFYLFAETNYVIGRHLPIDKTGIPLNEFRFSGGLGFHLTRTSRHFKVRAEPS
jgi:hypothetical protein